MLVGLGMLVCSGCTETKSPSAPQRADMLPAVNWLGQYYQKSPLAKGWFVTSIISQENQLQITVAIPPDQASGIKRQPADDQFRLVAEQACPKKSETLWQILPAGSSIKLLPSVSGQVFIEVDCGR